MEMEKVPVRRRDVAIEWGGRVFRALATPFDQVYVVRDPAAGVVGEVWDADSYRELPAGIPLLIHHFRASAPVGVIDRSWLSPAGLFVEGELTGSKADIEAWCDRWRRGIYSGCSVGFLPHGRQGHTRAPVAGQPPLLLRRGCEIQELSLTSWPAYTRAGVMGVHRKTLAAGDAERELIAAEAQLAETARWQANRQAQRQ